MVFGLLMKNPACPKCESVSVIRSGVVHQRQRYRCKKCGYHFTVERMGKRIDRYYVVKALQLYLEGLSLREIERLLGISHVTIGKWVREHRVKQPQGREYRPTYQVVRHDELVQYLSDPDHLNQASIIITQLGDKYMLIRWERFRDSE
jgi:transposase-like protein